MPINSFSPPRIVIDTNSPAHAESSPHVRRTLDINRESDIHAVAGTPQTPISIHALRKESDPGTLRLTKRSKNFNPHSPCGERPSPPAPSTRRANFNPHSPCGERPCWNIRPNAGSYFNPHSPCGERHTRTGFRRPCRYFNPHSPCGERRYGKAVEQTVWEFQSTLPLRGATVRQGRGADRVGISIHTPLAGSDRLPSLPTKLLSYFNPHSPCGERRDSPTGAMLAMIISIHTPLAGSDTSPRGGEHVLRISIHTPLAGSDVKSAMHDFTS